MLPIANFIKHIEEHVLFTKDDHVLLAVSGGKDSVLMAQLFKLADFKFSIAHCNFNLRGDESQRDEHFVKLLASTLDVPFHVIHFDTKVYAKENRLSTQMAARHLRYQWFEEIRTEFAYNYIAVAHHQNDSVETILLNLVRGTGISGLHGIQPRREKLVRPLLFLSSNQIENLIEENGIDFVEDSSNNSSNYARNSIRHNVVPVLKQINPNLEETFAKNAARFLETEQLLFQIVAQTRVMICEEKNGSAYFSIEKIKTLYPQKLLTFELLRPYHFTSEVVDEILEALDKQSGTSYFSSTHRATVDRSELIISAKSVDSSLVFIHPHDPSVQFLTQKLSLSYSVSIVVGRDPDMAYVDADKLIFPLILRSKQDGDRFVPLGMKQNKKISDFFIQQKVAVPNKSKVPILVNGNGEIIWVAGFRQDDRYKVKATTKKVAIFELSNQ
ncbi:MAG: tRNA lysidine(34) synthetase TilS [Pedobacter sp.]|nr:MAG: tRNA lysidine(34) synthetase TilS [Pedobacter sp.]